MENQRPAEAIQVARFGRRKVAPRVCIADGKKHIRTFLGEILEDLGFITCECAQVGELGTVLEAQMPDLVVLGLSAGGVEAGEMLKVLAAKEFDGKVLLLAPRASTMGVAIQELGESLGIAMLSTLTTPFGTEGLRESVATLLPLEGPPSPPVDVAGAINAGWLELWYQPKVNAQTLVLGGAEGLIRIRHPSWGIVSPAYFLPDEGDPNFRVLSEFVIGRAVDDWYYFIEQHTSVEIAINVPISFFQDPESVKGLCSHMPDHPAFEGLIVEINGTDVIRNLEFVKNVARQLRFHNIAISIDDLGAEWPSLVGLHDFPFVEIKVDQTFIAGCADDRLKQTVCRRILDLADGFGARTVAEGVETRADFVAVREMGFQLVQGFLFGKAMTAKRFAQTVAGRPVMVPR